ncbi:BPSL0761 family protein [Ideonella sp. A 288]|uniref:BPSL0761 family protein n=1 Tax=Ideonella sp. A 288 TaxID=1962181 RepID=UPI001185B3FD|nr:BPSL0761 family protein [Ideonella sp. A 288]
MTMPSERRRALRWTWAVLQDISNDAGVPAALGADVAAALAAFPNDRAVATCFLEEDDERLQRHLAAIEVAQEILNRARRCPDLTQQTRAAAVATDRHFPQNWEMSKAPWPMPPRDWVEFYLLQDMDAEAMRRELLERGIADKDLACERLARFRSGHAQPMILLAQRA